MSKTKKLYIFSTFLIITSIICTVVSILLHADIGVFPGKGLNAVLFYVAMHSYFLGSMTILIFFSRRLYMWAKPGISQRLLSSIQLFVIIGLLFFLAPWYLPIKADPDLFMYIGALVLALVLGCSLLLFIVFVLLLGFKQLLQKKLYDKNKLFAQFSVAIILLSGTVVASCFLLQMYQVTSLGIGILGVFVAAGWGAEIGASLLIFSGLIHLTKKINHKS